MNIKNTTNNDLETIWMKIPNLGNKGDQLLKSLKAKLKHHFTKEAKSKIIQFTVAKVEFLHQHERSDTQIDEILCCLPV